MQEVRSTIDEAILGDLIFGGQVLVFPGLAPMLELCRLTRQAIRQELATHHPVKAHEIHRRTAFLQRVQALQTRLKSDNKPLERFADALSLIGLDLGQTFWDRLLFRVVPLRGSHWGACASVGVHRDTWGSNIHQQINWWAPIYPVARNRTIRFYLDHWDRPLKNTTATWRVETYIAERNRSRAGYAPSYPSAPEALQAPEGKRSEPVIKPGDLLCFSAAHLHCSVPNRSTMTRFSFDIRTVNLGDLHRRRAAPNVDCDSPSQMLGLFRNALSNEPLTNKLDLEPSRACRSRHATRRIR